PSAAGYNDTGFGPDASLNKFRLDDTTGQDVHFYRSFSYTLNGSGQLTGQWQPDGRGIDPASSGATFSAAPRNSMLSVFNGMDPNGMWTLFIADVSGGNESTLVSWGLGLSTVVPEPASVAFVGLFA